MRKTIPKFVAYQSQADAERALELGSLNAPEDGDWDMSWAYYADGAPAPACQNVYCESPSRGPYIDIDGLTFCERCLDGEFGHDTNLFHYETDH